jgi:hypothetical protein
MGDRFRAAFGIKPRGTDVLHRGPVVQRFAAAQPVLPVDQLLLHWWQKNGGVVDRAQALTVPAVLRGRNQICSISTLPLQAADDNHKVIPRPLFRQIDPNTANVVVMAQTVEDLLFDAVAWWRVVGFGPDGYPSQCVRYAPDQVSLQPPSSYQRGYLPSGLSTVGVVWMEGKAVPYDEVIRFDSPNPGILAAGADAIGRALALGRAAKLYADSPRRRGYFRPTGDVDPAEDDDILEMLENWARGSEQRIDGYVPAALEYNAIQDSTPAELQLVQMQQRASLDIANMLGVNPEDLGISTTSRVYQNDTDRRMDKVNETLAPYMRAITDRLAMPDVTPDTEHVRFFLDDYLKADPKTRAEVQEIHHRLGATDAAEIRDQEGLPPRTITAPGVAVETAAGPVLRPATPALAGA